MYRKACGTFVLMVAGELPGDPEVEKPYSLEDVYSCLQDLPEQIERAVVLGQNSLERRRRGAQHFDTLGVSEPVK
jgi:hypothetical protein